MPLIRDSLIILLLIEVSFKIYGYGHASHKVILTFFSSFYSPKNQLTLGYHEKHADFWRM